MSIQQFTYRGSQINKVAFSDIEHKLEAVGINTNEAFNLMADEREYVYVSNGFLFGLSQEESACGEWHHYFKSDNNGGFDAFKFKFN